MYAFVDSQFELPNIKFLFWLESFEADGYIWAKSI
jgi:hypothetical protein